MDLNLTLVDIRLGMRDYSLQQQQSDEVLHSLACLHYSRGRTHEDHCRLQRLPFHYLVSALILCLDVAPSDIDTIFSYVRPAVSNF